MSRIRGKDTLPERIIWDMVKELKDPPQRWTALPGKPDFVFERASIVVFIDGCFWHRCPRHKSSPKSNKAFWNNKFTCNVQRDKKVNEILKTDGWDVYRFWECEVKRDPEMVLCQIELAIQEKLKVIRDVRASDIL
jgi:DNA mismatch endonuclease (patch repair protein)